MSPKDVSVAASTAAMPIELRGRMLTAIVLRIRGTADEQFYRVLDSLRRQAPHFFVNAPLILDLEDAKGLEEKGAFQRLLRNLKSRNLAAVGIQNGQEVHKAAAAAEGLVALAKDRDRPLGREERPAAQNDRATARAAEEAAAAGPTLTITEPVRSGQRIFADRGDLVVLAPVSSGAELIAAGNIHVYAPLRGRALAGINGDETARIFCQSLEAELIAIAGLYRTSDDMGNAVRGKRVQAFLSGDALMIEHLK